LAFQYNKRLLRQKTGGACLYLPKDGHWLASFELITPLPKRVSFSAAKKMKILHYVKTLLFLIQIFGVFCFFGENFVTPFVSTLGSRVSREHQGLPPD
jgi:hypothetical protein